MNQTQGAKAIIAEEFSQEREKDRKECQNEVGNALTAIEIEVQKKLSRFAKGETIYEIYPHLKPEEQE